MRDVEKPRTRGRALDYIFHPRSVAIVGASMADPSDLMNIGAPIFWKALLEFGFEGGIYPVNPKGGEVEGLKVYPSLGDIPGPVDYVISRIPAQLTPQLMKDCVAKGVKAISIFAAGFSDSGEEEGRQLEADMVQTAREGGVRINGPNCMGIYCPQARLSWEKNFPRESGSVGFFSQSGGNSWKFVRSGAVRGIHFSKVISYGNAVDLNEADFLEYFAHDPETKIITAYIEGVRDGRRFLRTLRETARVKPVIILKGGSTAAGTRAVASHTGSLAGAETTWDSLCEQTGAIRVHTIEELADAAVTFLFMSPPEGRRVGLIGLGGGESVQSVDDCERAGLGVPHLPQAIQNAYVADAGSSIHNPVDSTTGLVAPTQYAELVAIVSGWPEIDFLIPFITVDNLPTHMIEHSALNLMVNALISAREVSAKPMAVVINADVSTIAFEQLDEARERLLSAGFPIYPTFSRAAQAISKFIRYHEDGKQWVRQL